MKTQSYSSQKIFARTIQYTFCFLLLVIVVTPLYIGLLGGFKTMGQLMTDPFGFPIPFNVAKYTDLLTGKQGTFWVALSNSLIVSAGTISLTIVICVMAAFALARIPFRGRELFKSYFMLGLLFPLAVAILPLYLQIRNMKLLDSYMGVILPQCAFQIPMTILLLRGFFLGIPQDLEDACAIDGYGPLGFLIHMVIPLSTPILSTTGILVLVASWNNFFLPLLVFNDVKKFTLPMGVMEFQGQHMSDWNMILAYLTLAMVPAIILFIAGQKYIVAGLTGGAVKG